MGYATMSDGELLAAYYAGDDAAFDELHRRYYQRLVAFFRCLLLVEDADDLAAETFLRTARTKAPREGRFDPSKCSFKTWLYSIARNRARDHWRRQQREIRVAEGAEEGSEQSNATVEQVPSADPTPEELLAARTFSEPVHGCLAGLSLLHREVLLLADVEDFELSEIASMLGIPYGTAGSRLHNARQCMRTCLGCKGYRFVLRGSKLSRGTLIVMTFQDPDELLIYAGEAQQGA